MDGMPTRLDYLVFSETSYDGFGEWGCWLINGRLDNGQKASPGLRPQAVLRGDYQGAAHFGGNLVKFCSISDGVDWELTV